MAKKRRRRGLPPGLRTRNGKLYYYFRIRGRQIPGATGLAASEENFPQALVLRQQAIERAEKGRQGDSTSFGAVAREAVELRDVSKSTRATYTASIVNLIEFFGENTPVKEITPADIKRWMKWRRDNNISLATIRNGLIILSGIFKHARQDKLIFEIPTDEIKKPGMPRRKRVITDEEFNKYLAYAWTVYPQLAAMATLMFDQGLRPAEARLIRVGDLEGNAFWIDKSKTDAGERWVYLTKRSQEALAKIAPKSGYYFHADASTAIPWPNSSRIAQHEKVLDEVTPGDHWPLYSLRHTFATRGMRAGIHPLVLAKIMGHTSPVITEIYQHASEEDARKAMLTLEDDTKSEDKPGQVGTKGEAEGKAKKQKTK